jgi:hypothetical protein
MFYVVKNWVRLTGTIDRLLWTFTLHKRQEIRGDLIDSGFEEGLSPIFVNLRRVVLSLNKESNHSHWYVVHDRRRTSEDQVRPLFQWKSPSTFREYRTGDLRLLLAPLCNKGSRPAISVLREFQPSLLLVAMFRRVPTACLFSKRVKQGKQVLANTAVICGLPSARPTEFHLWYYYQ